MLTIAMLSLSGGQGKTTAALFLGYLLSQQGHNTLMVDTDPQHDLTTILDGDRELRQPGLIDFLKQRGAYPEGIEPVAFHENLSLIPADERLDTQLDLFKLEAQSRGLLRRQLGKLADHFQVCIIDSPPQRSLISLAVIAAADLILIPAELTPKGFGSLIRTLDLVSEQTKLGKSNAEVLGVIPFRDRWFGTRQSQESRQVMECMAEEVDKEKLMPSIRESERYKQAINKWQTLTDFGCDDLLYPFRELLNRLESRIAKGGSS
jgi:chromosome partitioning protein